MNKYIFINVTILRLLQNIPLKSLKINNKTFKNKYFQKNCMVEEKVKAIVRLMDTDVEGNTKLIKSLIKVQGIKFAMANAICNYFDFDKNKKIGLFNPEELKSIESLIHNPGGKLPSWLFNRRKDPETGSDMHLITTDLKLRKDFDIKYMKKMKSYKGMRHAAGQPVRGQRTRAHFRTGTALGVVKAKVAPKKAEGKEAKEKLKKGKK